MKELFIMWITFQLVVIGVTSVDMSNKVKNDTYVCDYKEDVPTLFGAVFPLGAFVPADRLVVDYCEEKQAKTSDTGELDKKK